MEYVDDDDDGGGDGKQQQPNENEWRIWLG